MAFTINIPGIIRLIAVWKPDEILAVNDASMVERSLSGRGGLANRAVAARIAVFCTPDGDVWPAFRDRLDPSRAAHQAALETRLSHIEPLLQRIAPEIAELGGYVREGAAHRSTGVIIQQAVGRLFCDDYVASDESYDAACTLQTWLSASPLRASWIRHSGALRASLDLIMDLSRGDMACAHATALAMQNIVKSVELMNGLASHGDNLAKIEPQEALAHCLRAPAFVIREAREGSRPGPVRLGARSLVLLAVERARRQRLDPGFAFFASAWNRCPAHGIVPELLAEVWRAARAGRGAPDISRGPGVEGRG